MRMGRADCVQGQPGGGLTGKVPLRHAAPDVLTCWRPKEPIEVRRIYPKNRSRCTAASPCAARCLKLLPADGNADAGTTAPGRARLGPPAILAARQLPRPPARGCAQVGSGTTELGARPWLGKRGYFDDTIGDAEFEEERALAEQDQLVRLRDKEHLAYFRVFRCEPSTP